MTAVVNAANCVAERVFNCSVVSDPACAETNEAICEALNTAISFDVKAPIWLLVMLAILAAESDCDCAVVNAAMASVVIAINCVVLKPLIYRVVSAAI